MTFYFNMIMIQKHQKQISFYIKLQYKYKKDKGLIIFIQFMIFIQICVTFASFGKELFINFAADGIDTIFKELHELNANSPIVSN